MLFETPTTETSIGWAGTVKEIAVGIIGIIAAYLAYWIKQKQEKRKADKAQDDTKPTDIFADIDDEKVKLAFLYLENKFDSHFELHTQRQFALMNLAGYAFWESDEKGECIFASDELSELIGIDRSSILENGWMSSLLSTEKESVVREWNAAVADHRDFFMDYHFVHRKQGRPVRTVKVNGRAIAVKNRKGERRFIGLLTELKEEKN